MKKSIRLFICALLALSVWSCSKGQQEQAGLNEKIQDTFMGARFGDSIETVIRNFSEKALVPNYRATTRSYVPFHSNFGLFSFGDMNWKLVNTFYVNGKLSEISFYTPLKSKEAAKKTYEDIKSAVQKKYKLELYEPTDTLVYEAYKGYDKYGSEVRVTYGKYESIGHEIWYSADLTYATNKFDNEANEEL